MKHEGKSGSIEQPQACPDDSASSISPLRSNHRRSSARPRKGGTANWSCAAISMLVCLGFPLCAVGEELKWHHSHHISKAETVDVGDVPGHVMGVAKATGVGFFEGGEVATVMTSGTFDYRNGAGKAEGYAGYTFEDGSVLFLKYETVTTPDPGGMGSSFKGQFSFTEGTGRFRGIKGSGSLTGRRLSLLGGGSEVYFNFAGTYSR